MDISSFDDLLQAARMQPEPQRLLFVFAAVELPDDATPAQRARFEAGQGGALVPLMCVDKTPQELASFEALPFIRRAIFIASPLRGRRPATVSRRAHHLSARHTIQASRHVGGTGTSGNICRTIIFRSRDVSSKSSSARARAKNGWRKPCSRWLGSGSCQS